MNLVGQVNAGYYGARYTEVENAAVVKGNDSAFGIKASAGLEYGFSEHIALALQGGCRILKLDDFGLHFYSPGNPPVALDLSGFFGSIGIYIRF